MKVKQKTQLNDGFLICLEDGSEVKVSEELYFTKYLYELEDMTREQVDELIFLDKVIEAEIICKKRLANGLKPRRRLFEYLREKGFEDKISNTALNNLEKDKYLNDTKLALKKIKRKMITSPISRRALVLWLEEQGIDAKTSARTVESTGIDDKEIAQKLILKKFGSKWETIKVIKYLASKGFEQDIIAEVTDSEELWNI